MAQLKEDFPIYTQQQMDFPRNFQLQKNATTSMT
jgi:hypothetical protein